MGATLRARPDVWGQDAAQRARLQPAGKYEPRLRASKGDVQHPTPPLTPPSSLLQRPRERERDPACGNPLPGRWWCCGRSRPAQVGGEFVGAQSCSLGPAAGVMARGCGLASLAALGVGRGERGEGLLVPPRTPATPPPPRAPCRAGRKLRDITESTNVGVKVGPAPARSRWMPPSPPRPVPPPTAVHHVHVPHQHRSGHQHGRQRRDDGLRRFPRPGHQPGCR